MQPDCQSCPTPERAGYTLLEMVLVLAVLIAVASISWPMMQRVYADVQLKQSVEAVRVKLAGTRIHAIDTGLVYQFRYEVGGRRFAALPAEVGAASSELSGDDALPSLSGRLPEDIRFQQLGADLLTGEGAALELSRLEFGNRWKDIFFMPDGSAVDAVFDLADSQERFIRLSVRGLTGGVRVGDPQRRARQ